MDDKFAFWSNVLILWVEGPKYNLSHSTGASTLLSHKRKPQIGSTDLTSNPRFFSNKFTKV